MSNNILKSFVKLESSKDDLINKFGDDLFNVSVTPETVTSQDVLSVIQKIKNNEVDLSSLIDWVNIIWFTDLFEYSDRESDSIASVMTVLETLDEEGVCLTDEDFDKMSMCLIQNIEYEK